MEKQKINADDFVDAVKKGWHLPICASHICLKSNMSTYKAVKILKSVKSLEDLDDPKNPEAIEYMQYWRGIDCRLPPSYIRFIK